jgi:hypothetical protein
MPEEHNDKEIKNKAYQEGQKIFYDAFKHLTSLSTGSILILVTFLEKFFKTPEWKFLIAASLVCFILSTVSSYIAMMMIGHAIQQYGEPGETAAYAGAWTVIFAIGTFLLGISIFVVFALKNFYW